MTLCVQFAIHVLSIGEAAHWSSF